MRMAWMEGFAAIAVCGAGLIGCGSDSGTETTGSAAASTTGASSGNTSSVASSTGSGSGGSGASSGSSTTSGSGGSTSSGTGGTGGSGTGGASFMGYSRVDQGTGSAVKGSADIAMAPDGTLYVTWVADQGGSKDVFVARSTDGGASFGSPVKLDDAAIVPLVSMARHPYVAADNNRVAVVFNDQAGVVYLYVSAAGALAFGSPIPVGTDITTMFRDFPKPLLLGDGSLAVVWHGYPMTGDRIFVSREGSGFTSEAASGGAPGVPCECCPNDLLRGAGGELMLAFRNNEANIRDMWMAKGTETGAFSSWSAISTTEGTIAACPMQGPRLAQLGANEWLAVWSTRGPQNTGSVFLSRSTNGGAAWSGGAPIGFTGDEPTIALGGSGRLFVTGVTGSNSSAIVTSDDGGSTWATPKPLQPPDGNLTVPQAEGAYGMAALAGVSTAGTVWLRRME